MKEHKYHQVQELVEWYRGVERLLDMYENNEATSRDVQRLKNILRGGKGMRSVRLNCERSCQSESWNSPQLAQILQEIRKVTQRIPVPQTPFIRGFNSCSVHQRPPSVRSETLPLQV